MYNTSLRDHFSDALDAYLAIHRTIDKLIQSVLKRTDPMWRIKHSCPPCTHRVPNEPSLKFDILCNIDGNNSLKRLADAGKLANRYNPRFPSDYFLSPDEVDKFKHEVISQKKKQKDTTREVAETAVGRAGCDGKKKGSGGKGRKRTDAEVLIAAAKERVGNGGNEEEESEVEGNDADDADAEIELGREEQQVDGIEYVVKNIQGDPTDYAAIVDEYGSLLDACTENWKANAKEEHKRSLSCFDENGIFLGLCRHHIVLIICDMIKSGEL